MAARAGDEPGGACGGLGCQRGTPVRKLRCQRGGLVQALLI